MTISKGINAYLSGDVSEAKQLFLEVLDNNKDDQDALHHLGLIAYDENHLDLSIEYYNKALLVNHNLSYTHYNLANVYRAQGAFELAINHYQKTLDGLPEYLPALNNYAITLEATHQYEKALTLIKKVLTIDPLNISASCNHIYYLNKLGKGKQALRYASKYYHKLNKSADYLYQYGVVLKQNGQDEKAKHIFRQCLKITEDYHNAKFNLSELYLKAKKYNEGWALYESRWFSEIFLENNIKPECHLTVWNGEILDANQKLFIVGEQGIGDQIMFLSILSDVVDRTSCNILLSCDKRLRPLLNRSFHNIEYYENSYAGCSHYIDLASLPKLFRSSVNQFCNKKQYLKPDDELVSYFKEKYRKIFNGKTVVGISWKGGIGEKGKIRSTSLIHDWKQVLSIPDIGLVNCQYGDVSQELQEVIDIVGVDIYQDDEVDPLLNLDTFSSQLKALDVLISVDNSTVHLAGALGIDIHLLLPFHSDWRWGYNVDYCDWYSSVKLHRQHKPGEWGKIFNKVMKICHT